MALYACCLQNKLNWFFWGETFNTQHKMNGRNCEVHCLPAQVNGSITKCRYLPCKIPISEIQKIDSKHESGRCHFRPDSEIQKINSKYDLQKCRSGDTQNRFEIKIGPHFRRGLGTHLLIEPSMGSDFGTPAWSPTNHA